MVPEVNVFQFSPTGSFGGKSSRMDSMWSFHQKQQGHKVSPLKTQLAWISSVDMEPNQLLSTP